MSTKHRKAIAALGGAAIIVATLSALGDGQAAAAPDRIMHLVARTTSSTLYIPCPTCIRHTEPAGAHIGGTEVDAGDVFDQHGTKVGHFTLYGVGATPFTAQGPGELMITATLVIGTDQIVTQGVEEPPDDQGVNAIVGGTGVYAKARGEISYTDNANGSANLAVHLTH